MGKGAWLLWICLYSSYGMARPVYLLEDQHLSPEESKAAMRYLEKAERLLPMEMKLHLPSLWVSFSDPKPQGLANWKSLFSRKKTTETTDRLPLPHCAKEASDREEDSQTEHQKVRYGMYVDSEKRIYINPLFLFDIVYPERSDRNFSCKHRSMFQSALATLLHETAHAYDFANIRTAREEKELALSLENPITKKEAKKFRDRNFTISDHPIFKKIIHKGKTKVNASPDSYELKSTKYQCHERHFEYFPINFEFYLLEPLEYRQHRPRLYEFFSEHFQHDPTHIHLDIPLTGAGILTKVPILEFPSYRDVDIAPDRVEGIDLLLISKGKAGESQFGHITLRLRLCSKSLTPGEACPETQRAKGVTVTYAADLSGDSFVNPIKGLFGYYPSAVSIAYFQSTLEGYIYHEQRQIASYPLKITHMQKQRLVFQILQDAWSYEGEYRFVTRNCSTEARDIIKSILEIHGFSSASPIMPSQLQKKLYQAGVIDKEPAKLYEPIHQLLDRRIQMAVGKGNKPPFTGKGVLKLSPGDRLCWYRTYLDPKKKVRLLAWQLLEQEILRARIIEATHNFTAQYGKQLREIAEKIQVKRQGYGIPSSYTVKIPENASLPFEAELNSFIAEESLALKAIQEALTESLTPMIQSHGKKNAS